MKNTSTTFTRILFCLSGLFIFLLGDPAFGQTSVFTNLSGSNPQIQFARQDDPIWSIGNIRGSFVFTQDSMIGTDDKVTILSNGNVGIGVGSPQTLLHIDDGNNGKVLIGEDGGTLAKLTVNAEAGLELARFRSDGNTKVYISPSGRFGVGTASPSGWVEIDHDADINDPTLELSEAGTDFARLRFRNTSNTTRKFSIISNPGSVDDPEMRITFEEGAAGGAVNILTIDGDDREVGINTTAPGAFLDVRGTTSSSNRLVRAISSYTGSSDNVAVQGSAETGSGDGWGGDFEGNFVGVRGGGYGPSATGPVYGVFGYAEGGNNNYAVYASGDLKATSQLFVGTNASQEAAGAGFEVLVDGQGLFEEVKIKNSVAWPDFVFEADYPLMSLDEVERHIDQKGHLPGIPSAQQIQAEDGFFIGDMHKRQLQKIEELTLYTIKLNKENKALKEEVQEMKGLLEALMARMEALEGKK